MGKRYSIEFREEAVNLIINQGLSIGQVSQELGVSRSSLDKWLSRYRARQRDPNVLSEAELSELKRLRKEVRILKMERDLLKKTAVYFAKTSPDGANS